MAAMLHVNERDYVGEISDCRRVRSFGRDLFGFAEASVSEISKTLNFRHHPKPSAPPHTPTALNTFKMMNNVPPPFILVRRFSPLLARQRFEFNHAPPPAGRRPIFAAVGADR